MKSFKFFNKVLVTAHDGGEIHCDELFYTVNKIELPGIRQDKVIPKYTIVARTVSSKHRDVFRPDHEVLWYFKHKQNAEWLIDIWKGQDKLNEWELKQRRRRTR